MNIYYVMKYSFLVVVIGLTQACSLNIPIDNPDISETPYNPGDNTRAIQLNLIDSFDENHQIAQGHLKINFLHEKEALKASPFIIESLKKEIASRKLPIEYSSSAENTIEIQKFEILNHRVSGFSPMVTISIIKAVLTTPNGKKNLSAMIKRGKVPVWSMSEVNEPCYNQPVELLIKELAAKINREIIGYSLDDSQVRTLVNKIDAEAETNKLSYFYVYELGFSNNTTAIEPLKIFAKHKGDYIRMAAMSSLGILGVEGYLGDLIATYKSANLWQDRGMALKAIGDIGNDDAVNFLMQERTRWEGQTSDEAKWNTLIIDLYL